MVGYNVNMMSEGEECKRSSLNELFKAIKRQTVKLLLIF